MTPQEGITSSRDVQACRSKRGGVFRLLELYFDNWNICVIFAYADTYRKGTEGIY